MAMVSDVGLLITQHNTASFDRDLRNRLTVPLNPLEERDIRVSRLSLGLCAA